MLGIFFSGSHPTLIQPQQNMMLVYVTTITGLKRNFIIWNCFQYKMLVNRFQAWMRATRVCGVKPIRHFSVFWKRVLPWTLIVSCNPVTKDLIWELKYTMLPSRSGCHSLILKLHMFSCQEIVTINRIKVVITLSHNVQTGHELH